MSDFDDLARDIVDASKATVKRAGQALQQAAFRTKDEWARLARSEVVSRVSSSYAASIDYEVKAPLGLFGSTFEAVVGPDLDRYAGKGGPQPSAGIFDDRSSGGSIRTPPARTNLKAEKFARAELEKGVQIAVDQTLREFGL